MNKRVIAVTIFIKICQNNLIPKINLQIIKIMKLKIYKYKVLLIQSLTINNTLIIQKLVIQLLETLQIQIIHKVNNSNEINE